MGPWDHGLLDNDTALDGLSELDHGVIDDIVALGAAKPSRAVAGKLAGAVGVLLQLSAYEFSEDAPRVASIIAAIDAQAHPIAKLPRRARAVLAEVAAGRGEKLAQRPAKLKVATIKLFHSGSTSSGFGLREPALFDSKEAVAYVGSVVRRCVEMIDEDFEDADQWSDLCREAMGIGCLAVLLVLEPVRVPRSKVARWQRCAAKGLAELEKEPNEELDFQRKYYRNLDAVFTALLALA
jgi:hypothetical protein